MNKKAKKINDWKYPRKVFLVFLVIIIIIFARYCFLALSPSVNGRNIQTFAANRNTVSKILTASRGTIYDATGNILANNVTSYTLIAYLDESRSTKTQINHVKDIDKTAEALAGILGTDAETLKQIMQKGKDQNKYQVEFGTIGRNLSELEKTFMAVLAEAKDITPPFDEVPA